MCTQLTFCILVYTFYKNTFKSPHRHSIDSYDKIHFQTCLKEGVVTCGLIKDNIMTERVENIDHNITSLCKYMSMAYQAKGHQYFKMG